MSKLEEVEKQLRPYQVEALAKLKKNKKHLNYLDMRLGKTVSTLCAVEYHKGKPCLIVCPKFGLYVWQNEIKKWFGEDAIVYTGKPKEREKLWAEFISSGCQYLITNFAMLAEIQTKSSTPPGTFKWQAFIADEIHTGGLFNHKTKTAKIVDQLTRHIPVVYLLTGTPFRQGMVDLYFPLHLMDRQRFGNYWAYVNRYGIVTATPFGKSIERNPANIKQFREMLKKYMIRMIKSEVFPDLPPKDRQPIPIQMDKEQQRVYDSLSEELLAFTDNGEVIITPGVLTLMIRQRQILVCPQEIGLKTRGAALDTLMEMSHEYIDLDKPIVVYTPFRKAVPYIEQAFHDEYDNCHIYKVQGKLTAEEFRDAWQGFQEDKFKRRVMICVIKSGASFKASAAEAGFFLGCEWDFNLNEQAEDRMFDPSKKSKMQVYYLLHKGTVEDDIIARLNDKAFSSNWVVGTEKQYEMLLEKIQNRNRKKG